MWIRMRSAWRKLAVKECFKLIKSPCLWLAVAAFFLMNVFIIYNYIGDAQAAEELEEMHKTILQCGVHLGSQNAGMENDSLLKHEINAGAAVTKNGNGTEYDNDIEYDNDTDYMEFYKTYVKSCESMYDGLDMMDILERKKNMCRYYAAGLYEKFIDKNYERWQERVNGIKSTGEGNYGFYPGAAYRVHGIFYGKVCRTLLLEMAALVMLSMLFLMDYERLHRTRELVAAARTGKKTMAVKAAAGFLCGMMASFILMGATFLYFFSKVSFAELWQAPVASYVMAEIRGNLFYPFITCCPLTLRQYFILSIAVFAALLLISGSITAAFYMLLQNSYFAFLCQCLFYMVSYLAAFYHTATFADVILAVFNPASLWITCGGWFMENDLILSFPANECWCIGCMGVSAAVLAWIGKTRYKKMDICG